MATPNNPRERNWFGHPPGLTILFLTEMWEMFSFFGMRALLVYYMTKHLDIQQEYASLIYGVYAAFVYFTPVFGGIVADRWLGKRKAVIIGGATMALGHFMMASEPLFYPALATIALGNGLFLPSLASQIEGLYREGDPRSKSAYNVYYVGVNIGAFIAPLICGSLGEAYGWHWGFAAAGIGMLTSLVIYLGGQHHLPPEAQRAGTHQPVRAPLDHSAWRRLAFLIGVAAIIVVFRGAYEQVGNTIALWADEGVDRHVTAGWSIPMTWFQSLDSLVVFTATPLLLARWARLAKRGIETPWLHKMAFGAAVVGLSYVLLAGVSAWAVAHGTRAHWAWLTGWFVLMTLGELYILPVGLGLFGRMAPDGFRATCIAIWFFAGFFGNLLAGALGTLWSPLSHGWFFMLIGGVAGLAALLLYVVGLRLGQVEKRENAGLAAMLSR
ncbi:peptide MFS transporter [Dyella nitratireducens]|uniref:MFS transporter n=1 Tax=Dyella nitratireducens TaxID=1849580 RepID=A0ABQ1FPL7_9GAMM|nr:peptide MFS transporter [Dyella nitratireducens]GGA24824.1 MFS transporter [Dyella nitratireducens]GLQ43774.1 MFS transporter [Dyella nitratireducens]